MAATTGSPTMSAGASPTAEATISARHGLDQRERLGRGETRRHHDAALARHVERHEARDLLEHQPVAVTPAHACQHEGGPDVGMAGEGHLGLGREDADLGGVRRVLRRQHEGRLGEVELGGDGLHLLGRQALGVRHDGQGIAAELPVGENVDGLEVAFHAPKSATAR